MSDPVLDAIYDWVSAASGFVPVTIGGQQLDTVHWSQLKTPRPPGAHIVMTLSGEREYGRDWMVQTDAPSPAPGADLEFTMTGPSTSQLLLECFAGNQPWDEVRPDKVLARVVRGRALPSRAAALRAAGVGFGPVGTIDTLAFDRNSMFEPRAQVTLTLHGVSRVSELGTWIEHVQVVPTFHANGQTITPPPFTVDDEDP